MLNAHMVRLLFILIFPIILTACGPREQLATIAAREKILLKGNGTEPDTLDPHFAQSTTEHHVLMALFEGLVEEHPDNDEEVIPGVAERWEILDNASRWIFHLREKARWSDGEPVTAGDFVFAYQRQLTPATGAMYASMLYKLKGAEDFHQGRSQDFASVGVKALNDRTLELTLAGPMPYFLKMLPHFTWYPLPRHVLPKYGGISDRYNQWTRPGKIVSNGAFRLKEHVFKKEIRMERNPHYWDAATVKLNGIRFFPITSDASEDRMFRTGRLHVTEIVPLDRIPHYKQNFPNILHLEPYLGVYFFRLNLKRPPVDNPKVRWALALALDRKAICDNVLRGGQIPAYGLTPPMTGYEAPRPVTHDPEKARRLLAEAGYPGGKDLPRLEIHVSDTESNKKMAEVVQSMWKTELGVQASIRLEDSSVFYNTQNRMDYQISRAGWIADYVEPLTFIDMWTTGNENNNTGWSSPEFDQLIRDSYREGNPAARLAILHRAEELFMADLPIVPIYFYTRQYLLHPAVSGWGKKVMDNHPYKFVDLEDVPLPEMH